MNIVLLVLLACMIAISSALAVPFLSSEQLLVLIFPAIIICAICGWISTFQAGGLHASKGLSEFFTYGFAVPVFKNWLKPLKLSISIYLLILSASLIAGVIVRIFIMLY